MGRPRGRREQRERERKRADSTCQRLDGFLPQKKKGSVSDVSSSIPTLEEASSESAPPSASVKSTVSVNEASMLIEGSSSVESEGSSGALNEGFARALQDSATVAPDIG